MAVDEDTHAAHDGDGFSGGCFVEGTYAQNDFCYSTASANGAARGEQERTCDVVEFVCAHKRSPSTQWRR
jgi:hypothetical protein